MGRPSSRWFRVYDAVLDSPKVQRLSDRAFRAWFNILCIACRHDGHLPRIGDLSFHLRMSERDTKNVTLELVAAGLLDADHAGNMQPHDWALMQFQSDRSTDRVQLHRKRRCNVSSGVSETSPYTETDTDNLVSTDPKLLPVQSERAGVKPSRRGGKRIYPADFEAFWVGYPTDELMSKKEAWEVWKRLPDDERTAATESLPAFRRYCQGKPDYRPVHACRYLSKRRSEGFLATAKKVAASPTIFVRIDTPQWDAWKSYYRSTKGTDPPLNKDGGWYFPSEFPPSEMVH